MPERNVTLSCAPPVALLHYRSLFPFALNELNLIGTGCEVGVQDGHFSVTLLKRWRGSLLYSIDPWREFEPSKYLDVANQQQAVQDRIYEGARNRLRKFGERSVIIRSTSAEGATQFAEGQLDFVYIDANHSYDAVVEDIRLWYPNLKPGGVLAGHDYLDGNYHGRCFWSNERRQRIRGRSPGCKSMRRELDWSLRAGSSKSTFGRWRLAVPDSTMTEPELALARRPSIESRIFCPRSETSRDPN